jgi:CheY-like chemotaxis protein
LLRVVLCEDRREIREGLGLLIGGTDGFRVVGSFRTMEEALETIGRDLPDVVLVDIGLPGMSGIEGIRLLRERYPSLARTGTVIPGVGTVAQLAAPQLVFPPPPVLTASSGAINSDSGQVLFGVTLTDARGVLLVATPK